MAGRLGRVLVGGRELGAGFAVGPRLVVTACHVVGGRKDKPVVYVPAGGQPVHVERVQDDNGHDAAFLWLASDVAEFLPVAVAVQGAKWRVESPPAGGNDPPLHGTVKTARLSIRNADGQQVEVVQLEVDEQLGDFGGYSGSAVLDSLGQAVLALLVEQKPLRTPAALGERRETGNVLYAVPIGDLIAAYGLPVRAARPLLFHVGLMLPGMVSRPGLLDDVVAKVIGAEGAGAGAGLVVLRGAGGVGKTVLARHVAEDVRVWAEFTDGIVLIRAGQDATADSEARQLQEILMCRDKDLKDVLPGKRLLLIVDDVWDRDLLDTLRANLPPAVPLLATARGAFAPGAVPVGPVSREEAIEILARGTVRSDELDRALGGLAAALFWWALPLALAAAEIHHVNWVLGDEDNSHPDSTEPSLLIARADALRTEFPDDPTMLDELENTAKDAAPRTVSFLVRRSLDWLGPSRQEHFERLTVYPPGAAITQPMLEDLWEASPRATRKEINQLAQAGLAQPVRSDPPTIQLHDLITAWLHHSRGGPGDLRHQQDHQRLAGLCFLPDGNPGKLTPDRAQWLAYHLVSAGDWDRLKALPTLRWRNAFQVATGTDAVFLASLDRYAHAARAHAPGGDYHAVRAWLFAAHVRTLIGRLPIAVLTAMAVIGDPIAAITQAGQHPRAGGAIPVILAAVADRADSRLLEHALDTAKTIPDDQERSGALAGIAGRLADTSDSALIGQVLDAAQAISDGWQRGRALEGIAGPLASTGDSALIERALDAAQAIPDDEQRGRALTGIARELAVTDPDRAVALAEQALDAVKTLPEGIDRSMALDGTARQLASTGNPALIGQALDTAQAIPDNWRSVALANIAGQLASTGNPALIGQALDMALAITDDQHQRSRALADIAGPVASMGDPALIGQLLDAAQAIPDDQRRSEALAGVAGPVASMGDPALIGQVLDAAQAISDGWQRRRALEDIAGPLASTGDSALIERALDAAQAIPDDEQRGRALTGIARELAVTDPDRAATLIGQVLDAAQAISDGWERGHALVGVAGLLAGTGDLALIEQAVVVAQAIPEDKLRSETLADIARDLAVTDSDQAATLVGQALDTALAISRDDRERGHALAGVAEGLASTGDPALIGQALDMALAIPRDDRERGRALAGVAGRLASTGNPALIEQVLVAAQDISHDEWRSVTLASVAVPLGVFDPDRATALIEQALDMAHAIPLEERRSVALAGVAVPLGVFDPDRATALIEQALETAQAVSHDPSYWEALAGIAVPRAVLHPDRAATLIEQIVGRARASFDFRWRSRLLAGIAGRLASTGDPALIKQALDAVEGIPDFVEHGRALAGIAGQLAVLDPDRAAILIERALDEAQTIPDDRERGATFTLIHALTRNGMLDELSDWRLRDLAESIELLNVFLGTSPDKTITESIGRAVLEVAKESQAQASP